MRFYPGLMFIFYILQPVTTQLNKTQEPEAEVAEGRCSDYLQRRLVCAENIPAPQCHDLGCCYDDATRKCYYPGSCRKLLTTAGGYSAMLLLPGQDPEGEESLSMLEGGNWCSRRAVSGDETTMLQTDLKGVYSVHSIISRSMRDEETQAFTIDYSLNARQWTSSQSLNGTRHAIGGSSSVTRVFYARYLRVQPAWTPRNPCVRLDMVICPGKPPQSPPPSAPPKASPVLAPEEYLPDERPSAIAVGSLGVILVASILVLFLLMDLPSYRHDLNVARKNIRSFLRHRKRNSNTGNRKPEEPILQRAAYRTKYIACDGGAEPEALDSLITDTNI